MSLSLAQGYNAASGLWGTNYLTSDPTSIIRDIASPDNSTTGNSQTTDTTTKSEGGISGFFSWLKSGFSDFATRTGIIILGFIFLAVGLSFLKDGGRK